MEQPQEGLDSREEAAAEAEEGPPRPPPGAEDEDEEEDVGPQPPKPKKRKVCPQYSVLKRLRRPSQQVAQSQHRRLRGKSGCALPATGPVGSVYSTTAC